MSSDHVSVTVAFPNDMAAPFQFSVALANLQKWFIANGLTDSECSTVMDFHLNLMAKTPHLK